MLLVGKSTISMAIVNSYFDITRGYAKFLGSSLGDVLSKSVRKVGSGAITAGRGMVDFLGFFDWDLPSGYVKIAIENGYL